MTSWRTAALRESTVAAARLPGAIPLRLRDNLPLSPSLPAPPFSALVLASSASKSMYGIEERD